MKNEPCYGLTPFLFPFLAVSDQMNPNSEIDPAQALNLIEEAEAGYNFNKDENCDE
jgi:hypothetical protein